MEGVLKKRETWEFAVFGFLKPIDKYFQTKISLIERTYVWGLVQLLYVLSFHFSFLHTFVQNWPCSSWVASGLT